MGDISCFRFLHVISHPFFPQARSGIELQKPGTLPGFPHSSEPFLSSSFVLLSEHLSA
jgi:hypothetical protein